MDNRLGNYKKAGVSADSLRRSRVENAVSLRKEKRDEVMSKRRNIQPEDHEDSRDYSEGESNINVNKIRELVVQTRSSDMTVKREAVQKIRKALSGDTKPPIDDMIRAGVTKALVECVDYDDPDVKFEACWGLTNIAGGEPHQTAAVVEAGAVPRLIKLLGSSDTNLCDQAVWGLGNVIGDGAYLRDYCIELGIMEPLMKLLTTPSLPRSLVRNIAWLIVNLCRFKCPRPTPLVIQALLPSLRFFLEDPDARVVREGMWALAYLTDGGDEIVQEVIKLGALTALFQLGRMAVPMLCHSDVGVQTAAIRVVGNIATGTDEQTQFLLDYGILRQLPTMLTHRKSKISKEAAWLCSNITAGTEQQVQAVVDANLVPYLIQLLELGDAPTRTEATWAIANITISGTAEQACYLVDQNVIPPLCGILGVVGGDPTILLVVLDAIHNILRKSGNREEEVCVKIEECGGLGTIERLEAHENEQIYHKAYDIIVEYFSQGDDRDEGDFWTAPGDGNTRRTKDEQMDVPEGGFSFK